MKKIIYSCLLAAAACVLLFSGDPSAFAGPASRSTGKEDAGAGRPVLLVLSPHYDDAVLSLGGLLGEYPGGKIVATFFTGSPKTLFGWRWDRLSGFSNSAEATAARKKENEAALALLSAAARDFNYTDYQYRGKSAEAAAKAERGVEADIEMLIARYRGRPIRLYGPAAFGPRITHPDHKILHDAFMAVAERLRNDPSIAFFLYEDEPYVQSFNQSRKETLEAYLASLPPAASLVERDIPLPPASLARKEAALARYVSQVRAFKNLGARIGSVVASFNETRCRKTEPRWAACEAVYQVNPATPAKSSPRERQGSSG